MIQLVGAEKLQRNLSHAEKTAFPKAAMRAINRVLKTLRTRAGRDIAKEMGVTQRVVKSETTIRRASRSRLEGTLEMRGDPLNLIRFKARQLKAGVSAAPWGNRRVFMGAFIARVNGTEVVMRRKEGVGGGVGSGQTPASRQAAAIAAITGGIRANQLPIRAMKGPGIAQTGETPEMAARREDVVRERMPIELESQLKYLASRIG